MRINRLVLTAALAVILYGAWAAQPVPDYSAYILTPEAPAEPRINSAKVFGVRPGSPLLYRVAATGDRPMTFAAEGLPEGVTIDPQSGQMSGRIDSAGTYVVTLVASNDKGTCRRELRIEAGERIALTPPMGWNSWNCWGHSVSQEKVLSSARALVDKGLADYGWTYINVDDGWQGLRGGPENALQPNSKFPDMKAMADEIHAMGLKLGIYSAPWVSTYASHPGSYSDNPEGTYRWIEEGWRTDDYRALFPEGFDPKTFWQHAAYSWVDADSRQWAEWGVDYLKYDWRPNDIYFTTEMRDALRRTGRDIVYSLSNAAPFADAPQWVELANCWRTTGDIEDTWQSVTDIGFRPQERWAAFNGPGHWSDADMLVVGMVGWGPELHYTRLTPDEQYAHVTLWALMASPMLIGCDIAAMDDFTLNLLCNFEVNDVLQDPLGMQAVPFHRDEQHEVYIKILEDGSLAVGLFNLSEERLKLGFEPRTLGLWGDNIVVRDLWRQQDVASVAAGGWFDTEVAPHGAAMYRLSPCNTRERQNYSPFYDMSAPYRPVKVE